MSRLTGVVKSYKTDKGFGFLVPDDGSGDVFTHFSYIIDAAGGDKDAGFAVGDKVAFELEIVDGKRQGKRVRVLSRAGRESRRRGLSSPPRPCPAGLARAALGHQLAALA